VTSTSLVWMLESTKDKGSDSGGGAVGQALTQAAEDAASASKAKELYAHWLQYLLLSHWTWLPPSARKKSLDAGLHSALRLHYAPAGREF